MSRRRAHLDARAIALMTTCCVLWGAQQVVVKATLIVLPPFVQASVRSGIAAAFVAAWSAARGIPLFARDRTIGPGLAAGVLFALEFLCIYAALPLTDASRVSVFIYLAPFVVALVLPRFEPAERLSAVQTVGMVAAFAALAWAFHEGFAAGRRAQWTGDALAILAAVFWGATTLVIRTTRLATAAPAKVLFYQLAVSAVVLAACSIATGERWMLADLPAWGWLSLAFQSIVIAFASYLAWFWLLAHYPATRLSAFSFLTPMFGLVFATLALGEAIGSRLAAAMVFVAIGIALVNRRRRTADPAAAREAP